MILEEKLGSPALLGFVHLSSAYHHLHVIGNLDVNYYSSDQLSPKSKVERIH